MSRFEWPYPLKWDAERVVDGIDVLVLGGGIAGCWAAIGAAKSGARVVLVEKGATIRSGAAGSGCDHWESAATNPCSRVAPEELTRAMIDDNDGYNNGISHYIECREGYDRLLDLEAMGAKIRDTEDEFVGAEFRDEKTKLLFAYDYENKFTLRVWGTTFKAALYRECRRRGVRIFDRTMATDLLTEGGATGSKVVGAVGVGTRTGELMVFEAKATVLCMSRPTRIWLFSPEMPGVSEFRPPQCTGDGHAMGWRAGVELAMMEKSVRAEWSGDRSFPPYGTGNNHNTWYACSMVDSEGRDLPWADRDGRILTSISDRYRPSAGQKFFIKGGCESNYPSYEYKGPDTLAIDELLKRGYKPPFYADLPGMPELERKAIWGLMVGQEGKTKIPIFSRYSEAGFDPSRDLLQSYGDGWKSATFLPDERQLFGLPGGIMNDWHLRTNLEGLYAAGDQLFASNCHGHAATTGHYAGRHAAVYARSAPEISVDGGQLDSIKNRMQRPLERNTGLGWKDVAVAVVGIMKECCGANKTRTLLETGLARIQELREGAASEVSAANPHEWMRCLEALNVLDNAEVVLHACLARRASSKQLNFNRSDYPEMDPPEWHKFILVRNTPDGLKVGEAPLDYYGSLKDNYKAHNRDYVGAEEQ